MAGIKIGITLDPKTWKEFNEIPYKLARTGMVSGLKAGLQYLSEEIAQRAETGPLKGRSLKLSKSWRSPRNSASTYFNVKVTKTETVAEKGSKLEYAAIHNFGGEITPKKAKWLAVPLAGALKSNGEKKVKSPREMEGLFVLDIRGKKFLVRKRGKGAGKRLEFMYVLKKKVQIPARRYIDDAIKASEDKITNIVRIHLQATLNEM